MGMGSAVIIGAIASGTSSAQEYEHPDDLYAALVTGPATTLRFAGGVIDVVFADGAAGLNRALVLDWIKRGAQAMIGYFGRFPAAQYGLLVIAQPGNRVGHATTYGYRGTATRITVGVDADARAFAQDWVLVHEMCHGALPDLPRQALWLQEGNATYVEPIARARVGQLSAAQVWRQSLEGMPRGLPQSGEGGMAGTMRHDRLYWGGAIFWLLAEVEIYQISQGRGSLRDAMRACNRSSGGNHVEWSPERLMAVGDGATGTQVLSKLYDRFAYHTSAVDLAELFRQLGVSLKQNRVMFDEAATLSAFRRSITQ